MQFWQQEIRLPAKGRGLWEVTGTVCSLLPALPRTGLLNLYLPHTSASLLIQENADPTARKDLESFLVRLIPDGESWHVHTLEGEDDSSSHMKAAITQTFLQIPVREGRLGLGTWQGIYLWEHRKGSHARKLILTLMGDSIGL